MQASDYVKYLYEGLRVQDEADGDIGYITEPDDIHNIFVTFPVQPTLQYKDMDPVYFCGTGLYCLDKKCKDFHDLKIIDEDFIKNIRENKLKRIV